MNNATKRGYITTTLNFPVDGLIGKVRGMDSIEDHQSCLITEVQYWATMSCLNTLTSHNNNIATLKGLM